MAGCGTGPGAARSGRCHHPRRGLPTRAGHFPSPGVGAREASTPLASLPIIELVAMSFRRHKKYLVFIEDERGGTHRYFFTASSRRRAKKDAKDWVGEALVGVEQAEVGKARRLLALAAVTFAVGGAAIAAMMIVGLRLEGAL